MPKHFVLLVLFTVTTITALVLAGAQMPQYLTAFISLAALVVSLVSAFKEDIFPFRPNVLFEEVDFVTPTGPSPISPTILLPVVFVNEGHGAGVIEGMTLKVETESGVKIYTPFAEVDYQKFISGKRALDAENILGAFNLFPLSSRESVKKCIVFSQEEHSERYPFTLWSPGKHIFRLFTKDTAKTSPTEVGAITIDISEYVLNDYKTGVSASMSPSRELHV